MKNPTGLNQTLATLNTDLSSKALFFALNDNAGDGRDVSWIWDAQVEDISTSDSGIKSITCSGLRSGDAALRFKYAGFDEEIISVESDLETGIKACLGADAEVYYFLCTYSTLFSSGKILSRLVEKSHGQQPDHSRRKLTARGE